MLVDFLLPTIKRLRITYSITTLHNVGRLFATRDKAVAN